jgi:hypothetical protein
MDVEVLEELLYDKNRGLSKGRKDRRFSEKSKIIIINNTYEGTK